VNGHALILSQCRRFRYDRLQANDATDA
jgi:hypothetical protein